MSKVAEYYFPELYGLTEIINFSAVKASGAKIKQRAKKRRPIIGGDNAVDDSVKEDLFNHYWDTFDRLVDAAGGFAWIYKLEGNVDNGVYPTQKVKKDYFKTEAHFEQCKQDRRMACWRLFHQLNDLSVSLGFKALTDNDARYLVNFLVLQAVRRRWFKSWIKKYKERRQLVSIKDLVTKRIALEEKKKSKN